jgi:membrane protein DedA with SNARE-associated domain/membrane-associated phospholipid phosphatase
MLEHSFQSLVNFLHAHPHWGGVIAFVISLIESLPLVGTLVPGSVTMTGIGALIGAGVLPGLATFIWAIAGAYVGDCFSYWLGIYYNERLRNMWPFNKHGKWLKVGEDFFRKHFGPIRSLIPLIAGLLKMPPMRFLPFAFISATLWAIVYMVPGLLLGALALELPPKVATQFVLLCLLAIALLWGIIWAINYFVQTSWEQVDRLFIRLWDYLNTHKRSHWITQLLRNPAHEEDHVQLLLTTGLIFMCLLFLWVALDVFIHGFLTRLNLPIFNLLQSFRLKSLDHFAIVMTLLGYVNLLLITATILFIFLLWQRRFWTALHWLAVVVLSAGLAGILKKMFHEPRPPLVRESIHTGSFPSGHVTLSTAVFGFLAVIIAHHLPTTARRSSAFWSATILVVAIALSRIYLGAHWFTDILEGIFLGLACVLLVTLSYRRRTPSTLSPARFSITVALLFLLAWLGFGITRVINNNRASINSTRLAKSVSQHQFTPHIIATF